MPDAVRGSRRPAESETRAAFRIAALVTSGIVGPPALSVPFGTVDDLIADTGTTCICGSAA